MCDVRCELFAASSSRRVLLRKCLEHAAWATPTTNVTNAHQPVELDGHHGFAIFALSGGVKEEDLMASNTP
jgi:hypothetical protein